jgi:CDP-diacylglycerol--glycerol-3-phosphate 3-phosphatidyltransferase
MKNEYLTKQIFTPANIVTTIRIALIPVFVFVILAPWPGWFGATQLAYWFGLLQPWIAAAVFAILALTDSVDGYLARSRQEVTTLGKFLDPLADKILVTAALLALIELGSLPAWVAIVIIAREFLVSGLRMVASAQGEVIAASPLGKLKTWFQIIAVILFIIKGSALVSGLPPTPHAVIYYGSWAVMLLAILLTLLSMLDYFFKSARAFGIPVGGKAAYNAEAAPTPPPDVTAEQVITAALSQGKTISTAESLTGGLIGAALTSVPGSSAAYVGGVNSYTEQVKIQELGVRADILAAHTVVSSEVAAEMALGALRKFQTDLAVSVTGVAGPGGGSQQTPVGTVWHGLAWRDAAGQPQVQTSVQHYPGDRAAVRSQTTAFALSLLSTKL